MSKWSSFLTDAFMYGAAVAIVLVIAIVGGMLAMFLAELLIEWLDDAFYSLAEKVRQRRQK